MPIYAMRCDSCGKEEDVYRSVAKMNDDLPNCCGAEMKRKICKPYVMSDLQPYRSMIDGTMIESRSKHREHLKDHGMIELGNEKPAPPRRTEVKDDIKKDLHEVFAGYGG